MAWSAAVGRPAQALLPTAPGAAAVVPGATAAKIQFAAPVFEFGRIAAGTVVNHDYVFTNVGAAPLVVTGVLPSCDCTAVGKWSARLEPGRTGRIPIRFNSAGYGGAIDKWILVASNDPDQPKVKLVLRGTVWKPIEVSPPNAVFATAADAPASETKVIRITNNTDEPLILSPPESRNRAFAVELKTVRPGKEFELRVTTVPPPGAGTVPGLITIKTNSAQVPVIAVTALAVPIRQGPPPGPAQADQPAGGPQSGPPSPATAAPAAGPLSAAAVARVQEKGLQVADRGEVAQWYHDPGYAGGRIVLVDARDDAHYRAGHIPGAWLFDHRRAGDDLAAVLPACLAAAKVVVYCADADCDDSESAAILLRDAGVPAERLFVYPGGMTDWRAAALPMETGARHSGVLIEP